MKNLITLILATATIDLIVVGGSSFSQKTTQSPIPPVDSNVIWEDPKFKKFIADTTAISRKIEHKVDCVRIEHSITKERIRVDKKLIATQRTSFEDLYQIKMLLNHGRQAVGLNVQAMPKIRYAKPSENIQPLPVNIDTTPPDTLRIPEHKRSFFDRIFRFWK